MTADFREVKYQIAVGPIIGKHHAEVAFFLKCREEYDK